MSDILLFRFQIETRVTRYMFYIIPRWMNISLYIAWQARMDDTTNSVRFRLQTSNEPFDLDRILLVTDAV